ncbi:MAG: type VI secretion system baseplate subunit TssG [Phycisphaerae bacterium]|nr:type VI secretion system baseplate subunit TssG [Phycisphaerae bacterium]
MTASETLDNQVTAGDPRHAPLFERMLERAARFDFFQAVWLLERHFPGTALIGQRGPVSQERLRFRPSTSLGFPAADVSRLLECRSPADGRPFYLLEILFLGLYGVSTPLPLHYAIDVLRATERTHDPATDEHDTHTRHSEEASVPGSSPVRDFVDLFHHRLTSLFFRSWLKYRYERMFGTPERDVLTDYLRFLVGGSPDYGRSSLGVEPVRLLRYAGILTQRPRSAVTLAGLLHDYFGGIVFRVEQFLGQWMTLGDDDLNRIGCANSSLGVNTTIGEQVYDLGGAFTITIGPVDWATYVSFVPGGWRFNQTRALTKLYSVDPLAFNIEVTLSPGEVPETRLTSDDTSGRLGMTTWVRTEDLGETTVAFDARADAAIAPGTTVASTP